MVPNNSQIKRNLQFLLPAGRSAFLWGPRQTGKTTYLNQRFPQATRFDFLHTQLQFEFAKSPSLLRERLLFLEEQGDLRQPIVLDEVQKVPGLLDEIHGLIEQKKWSFILCGSSARKLKRSQANLLGGRAWRYCLHPLTSAEIGDLDLLRALRQGLLPAHYLAPAEDMPMHLRAYVTDYLKEEIQAEGLVRNLPAFSRFVDTLGFATGEMVNYSNIAREMGVDGKTVCEYFQILQDTYIGYLLEPYTRKGKRAVIGRTPRFYLFDVGVAGHLAKRGLVEPGSIEFGRAFEHFLFMEILAYRDYSGTDFPMRYWRTSTGLEVDFILGEGAVAIEVKGRAEATNRDTKGLRAFLEEGYGPCRACVVTTGDAPRKSGDITVLPWQLFLEWLWAGKLDP